MKKKTISLLNSLKTVVETSYPNLPRKIQKQILEDFVYDSMINQLGQWAEDSRPDADAGMDDLTPGNDASAFMPIGSMKGAKGFKAGGNWLERNKLGIKTMLNDPKMGPAGVAISGSLALAIYALTGWSLIKCAQFAAKYGKKGLEVLKKKFKPSMKNKAMNRLDDIKKAVALAETTIRAKKK